MTDEKPRIPRPVWFLGWTSLFTDAATEMIYPLLPVYLSRVLGASAVSLGIIEGVAEGVNSLLKVISGYWSDRRRGAGADRHRRLHALINRAAADRADDERGRRCCSSARSTEPEGHSRRAARCVARALCHAVHARPHLRLSRGHGSCRRDRRPAGRDGVPVLRARSAIGCCSR